MLRTNLLLLASLLAATSTAYGGIVSQQSLSTLIQAADLIVVGSASGNLQPGPSANFSLMVARVVKGQSAIAGTEIAVQWNRTPSPGTYLPGGTVVGGGIWFFQQSPGGWSLLPVVQGSISFGEAYYPASVSPLPDVYAYAATASLQDKVVSELSAAIESAQDYNLYQFYTLLDGDLDQVNSPVANLLYHRLSSSASVQGRTFGLGGLIRNGSVSALTLAVSSAASSATLSSTEYGMLLSTLRDRFRSSDATSTAIVGPAATDATDPNLAFRVAAAHALAAIHSIQTLPYLAALLDDSRLALRAEAVSGLGAFAIGLPIQTSAQAAPVSAMSTVAVWGNVALPIQIPALADKLPYLLPSADAPYVNSDTLANFSMDTQAIERSEWSYVSFWKTWWLQNKASLGF